MVRAFSVGLFAACAVAALAHAQWLALPLLTFVIAMYAVARAEKTTPPANCPDCRKMVNLGATACHHCGRVIITPKPQQPEKLAESRILTQSRADAAANYEAHRAARAQPPPPGAPARVTRVGTRPGDA